MPRTVGVVIAVRNEEGRIGRTIAALAKQTVPPRLVVVVDDGSTDETLKAVEETNDPPFEVRVVSLPHHEGSYVGRPELARVFNAGLEEVSACRPPVDYVMHLGSDHVLPPDYIDGLIRKMEADPRLAVAGGWIVGEPFNEFAPRGSGMLVSAPFWREANGMRFPVAFGWESWVYLKATQMGYRSRSFRDVRSTVSRKTSVKKGALYGRGMYALGYDPVYAMGRCLFFAARSPRSGLQMLRGYIDHRGVSRTDVSAWVGPWQRRNLVRRALSIVSRRGRK